jgi:RNA polymerase sigma factor (sigma-70 family)
VERTPKRIGERDRELIRELYPSLCRYAAIVGPVELEPEDLVQESLYRTLRRGSLVELQHPTAYLRRAILNEASNQRRSAGRRRRAIARMGPERASEDAYPSDVAVLLRLPPRTRAVIYMREIEGHSYAEIAEVLGCGEASARATAARGRRALRDLLAGEVGDASA